MGQIKVEKSVGGIKGLCVVEPAVHGDTRGYFMETYNEKDMKEAGVDIHFVQDNQSMSTKGDASPPRLRSRLTLRRRSLLRNP